MTRRLIQPWLLAALAVGVSKLANAQSGATATDQALAPQPSAGDSAVPSPSSSAPGGAAPVHAAPAAPAPAPAPAQGPVVEPVVEPPSPAQTTPTTPAAAPSGTSSAPVATAPAIVPARLTRPKWGWDVNLEGAYGRYFPDHQGFGFGRVRGGMLYSADPVFYAIGLTYEWSNLAAATFGIQAEALHIESGVWVQAGALGDTQVHPGAQFALGWSVLGVEAQYRKFDPSDWGWALVGKLRIPVTFIAKAFE